MEVIPIAKSKITNPNYQDMVVDIIKDKYQYILLGVTVILISYLVFSGFLSSHRNPRVAEQAKKTTGEQIKKQEESAQKYTVSQGDDLWHIAEAKYGSGYNAYDIASANHISSPYVISAGQELVIPSVTPKQTTTGEIAPAMTKQVTITSAQYTVQHGDYLWKIAENAYGDGHAWVRIAQANHLANPDMIFSGNVLVIPR